MSHLQFASGRVLFIMIHVESAKQSLSSFSISSSLAAAAQKIGSTVSLESDWSDGKVCAPNQLVPKYAILLLLALIGVIATILSSNRMLNDFSVSSIDDSSILWTDHAVRMDVIELSKTHAEPPSNVTAAICFKTLFGDIDLGIVIQWAGEFVRKCFVAGTLAAAAALESPECWNPGMPSYGRSFSLIR